MSKQRIVLALVATACMAGCGRRSAPLPTTYPVHGKVAYKDGTPVTGGVVQFQPQAEPSVTTAAMIGNDGTYSLTTTRSGLRAEGAVAGPNRVTVTPSGSGGDRQSAGPQCVVPPTIYPTPYTVESRDNEFNMVVERARGSTGGGAR